MIELKSHIKTISDLHQTIQEIRDLAESLPESTEKGYLLANLDAMQRTADDYTEDTIGLYEKIMNFAMRAAV